ncbi:MAG: BatA domain-containing protein, partial [Planctomycetota bacterium]
MPLVGSLSFLSPWLLVALALLPALWWLLKVTPPAPRRVRFPALRLLIGLRPGEETAARTPLWLALLRLLLAAILILALAHPVLRAGAWFDAQGPVLLVIDDGWPAARDWAARRAAMTEIVDQAEREGRAVALLTTAAPESGEPIRSSGPMRAAKARGLIQALRPKPWTSDRAAAAEALAAGDAAGSAARPLAAGPVIWISDGVEDGAGLALAERLQRM